MCCENYWKRIVSFAIALTVGVLITGVFKNINNDKTLILTVPTKEVSRETGNGIGDAKEGIGGGGGIAVDFYRAGTNPLQLISKPRPNYTDAARQNQVTGVVRLKVTFLASGGIGNVSAVNYLPDGLTEQAIAAAKQIKFLPATQDGKPITVSKTIEYSFSIY